MTEPHAITRARERYNVELCIDDLEAIGRQIRDRRAFFVQHGHSGAEAWMVEHAGRLMLAVYKPHAWRVVTFWPPDDVRWPPLWARELFRLLPHARRSPRDFREVAI